ncbi:MAG: Ig-like domain-containing protein [Methanomassiliicoccales archaeon]|nr:MAG: Ig-like domain-containing protein [Methanomassiliicoccales archaeon]
MVNELGRKLRLQRTLTIILVFLLIFGGFIHMMFFLNEDTSGTNVAGGHISTDTTWTEANSPYIINGDIVVDFGTILTIESGVVVRFSGAYYLYIEGTLRAFGATANHITFTSDKGKPSEGDWKSIKINSTGRLRMNYCDVSYGTYSINIYGSEDNIIENSTVSYSSRHGIFVRYSSYTKIKNSVISTNLWNGIYFLSSLNIEINNCDAYSNAYEGISLADSSYINIADSDFKSNYGDGIHVFSTSNLTLSNSQVHENIKYGIILKSATDISIDTCDIFSNGEDGIYLPDSLSCAIKNCNLYDQKNGLYLFNSSLISVQNSEIYSNSQSGITLMDSSLNTLDNLDIYSSGNYGILLTRDPILKAGSSHNTISKTSISDNLYGITMRFSENNTVEDGYIKTNTNAIIAQECENIRITGNNISYNDYYGLSFIGSSNGEITENELFDNYYGIFLLAPSSNNIIHHNTVKDHMYYAYGASLSNQWDDGAQGNYWGDYDGIDADKNGIGDDPYPINPKGEDRYPLVDFNNTVFKVLSSTPSNESTHVPIDTKIKLFFSEGVIKGTFIGNITITPSATILSYTWEDSNKNVALTLSTLSLGEFYTVIVYTNATGVTGRSLRNPYVLTFYTENPSDSDPPQVTDVFPSGLDVPVDLSSINVTFSETMHRSTTEQAFSIEPWVPGYFTWENTTLQFHPTMELMELTQYTITLNGSVAKDAVGHLLDGNTDSMSQGSPEDDYIWQFKTARYDFTPPVIYKVEPTGNMVDINSHLKVYFSELMNKSTVESAFSYTNGTVTWSSDDGTWGRSAYVMTFIPSEPFEYSQVYTVTIKSSATDLYDNSLDGNANGTAEGSPKDDFSWSFKTTYDPDIGLPFVIEASPTGIDADIDSEISVNFSQTMNQTSVKEAFTITDGTVTWTEDNGTFLWEENRTIFIPSFTFDYDTTYTVKISTTAKNILGQQLDGNANGIPEGEALDAYSWSFKTKALADLLFSHIKINGTKVEDPNQIWYADSGANIHIGVNVSNMGYISTGTSFEVSLLNLSGEGEPINLTFTALDVNQDSGTCIFSWPAPTSLGDHFVKIVVDPDNEILEANENNNFFTIHFAIGPDYTPQNITVDDVDASIPGEVWYVDLGVPVKIGVKAKNMGFSGVSSDITYSIAFWNSTADGSLIGSSPFELVTGLLGLNAGESSGTQTGFWYVPNEVNDFYVAIIIDYDDTTVEVNEGNNLFILHFAFSFDYAVASILVDDNDANDPGQSWNATAEEQVSIDATATNLGLSGITDSITYRISFYNSTNRGTPLEEPFYYVNLPGLASGELSQEVTALWHPPNSAGDHFVVIIIEADNILYEENKDNNRFVLHFKIGPDIIPARVLVNGVEIPKSPSSPIYVGPKEIVDIEVNATNLGFSGTGTDFYLALYNGTRDGVMLSQPYFNLLVPTLSSMDSPGSDSGSISAYWLSPLAQGLYYVIVFTDLSGLCDESDENNNFWVLTFVVSPDLIFNNITVDGLPISSLADEIVFVIPGQSILIGAGARNIGDSSTGIVQFGIAFYNSTGQGVNLKQQFAFWDFMGPLEKNGFTPDVSHNWRAPYPVKPTDYYINISVDYDLGVPEEDETNNHYILHIRVDAPDLTPDRIAIETVDSGLYYVYEDPQASSFVTEEISVPLDSDITIIFDVINVGGRNQAIGTNVTLYNTSFLFGEPNATPFYETLPSWILLDGRTSPTSDQTSDMGQTIFAQWTNPGVIGLWYLNITIDIGNKIAEFNEYNNTFTIIINITDFPTTQLQALEPSYSGPALYVNSSTELKFNVSGASPPFVTWYRILNLTNGSEARGWTNYTKENTNFFMLWGEGTFKIEFNSTDGTGKKEIVRSKIVMVDDTVPQTNINIDHPRYPEIPTDVVNITSTIPILFSAYDLPFGVSHTSPIPNASGVKTTYYCIQNLSDGIFVINWTLALEGIPFYFDTLLDDGLYRIWFNSTDCLGQKENLNYTEVDRDNTGPTITINVENPKHPHPVYDWYVKSTTLFTLNAFENVGSGADISTIQYKITYTDGDISSGWVTGFSFDIHSAFMQGEGNYTIEYNGKDNLGNIQSPGIIFVYVDDSPPKVTLDLLGPNHRDFSTDVYNITDSTVINISCEDGNGCGISTLTYRMFNASYDSGWISYLDEFTLFGFGPGPYTIQYNGTDGLGNSITMSADIFLDLESPVTALDVGDPKHRGGQSDKWNITSSTPLSVYIHYENGSGLAYMEYRITNSTFDTDWMLYTGVFYLDISWSDGDYNIRFRAHDNLGNVEGQNTMMLRLDNSEPESYLSIMGIAYGKYVSSSSVFVKSAIDGSGSGIKTIWHRIYGNDTGFYYSGWISSVSFSILLLDGNYTIEYYAVDNLSNIGYIGYLYIYLDNSRPESFISIDDPKYYRRTADDWKVADNTLFILQGQDGAGCGIEGIYYSIINDTNSEVVSSVKYTQPFDLFGLGGDGPYTIRFWARDNLGNLEFSNEERVILDGTSPKIIFSSPSGSGNAHTSFIQVIFNEDVNHSSVELAFSYTNGVQVWDYNHGFFNWNHNVMSFYPYENLLYGTFYEVRINTLATDSIGNELDGDGDGIYEGESDTYSWNFETREKPDFEPPTIVGVSPSENAQDVPIDSDIVIEFSEIMNEISIDIAFSYTDGNTIFGSNEGDFIWNKNTTTFTPRKLFVFDTEYSVTLSAFGSDISGNSLVESYTWTFKTERDNIPPSIIVHSPMGGSVTVDTIISVTFDEAMATIFSEEAFIIVPFINGSFAWEENTLIFTPGTRLEYDTTYYITIGIDMKDAAGNVLAFPYTFNFTTELDTYPPFVIVHFPSGIEVDLNTNVSITFSEAMDYPSVEGAFSIEPEVEGNFIWDDNTIIFNPVELTNNTLYIVRIGEGGSDLAGNGLVSSYQFSFTTKRDPYPPFIIEVSPHGSDVPIETSIIVTFSEKMNLSTLYGSFKIEPFIPGSIVLEGGSMGYVPNGRLAKKTVYNVTITSGAEDLAGNSIEGNYSWEFETESDKTSSSTPFPWDVLFFWLFIGIVTIILVLTFYEFYFKRRKIMYEEKSSVRGEEKKYKKMQGKGVEKEGVIKEDKSGGEIEIEKEEI